MNKFQQQGKLKVVNGSILNPENAGLRFVLSVNNTLGKIDNNPLYGIFDKKWKKVKEDAKGWYANKTGAYRLGAISTTAVQSDTWVIHMLCQDDNLDVNVEGLKECLKKICANAKYEKASVHVSNTLLEYVPQLKELLLTHLVNEGVNVSLYNS